MNPEKKKYFCYKGKLSQTVQSHPWKNIFHIYCLLWNRTGWIAEHYNYYKKVRKKYKTKKCNCLTAVFAFSEQLSPFDGRKSKYFANHQLFPGRHEMERHDRQTSMHLNIISGIKNIHADLTTFSSDIRMAAKQMRCYLVFPFLLYLNSWRLKHET